MKSFSVYLEPSWSRVMQSCRLLSGTDTFQKNHSKCCKLHALRHQRTKISHALISVGPRGFVARNVTELVHSGFHFP
jgi:hypothetical protein